MRVTWTKLALEEYAIWQTEAKQKGDQKHLDRIRDLIANIKLNPFKGLGKPEPLKYLLSTWWSRRITREHRLVYRVSGKGKDQMLEIAQCRYHY
jgi:toxin YoeB